MNRTLMGSVGLGALAGIGGGLVMGLAMQLLSMLHILSYAGTTLDVFALIATMVGSSSVLVGWGLHMVLSALMGGVFGAMAFRVNPLVAGLALGFGEWFLIWVAYPAVMLVVLFHEPVGADLLNLNNLLSLVAHLAWGFVTALAFALVTRSQVPAGVGDDEEYDDEEYEDEEYEEVEA